MKLVIYCKHVSLGEGAPKYYESIFYLALVPSLCKSMDSEDPLKKISYVILEQRFIILCVVNLWKNR